MAAAFARAEVLAAAELLDGGLNLRPEVVHVELFSVNELLALRTVPLDGIVEALRAILFDNNANRVCVADRIVWGIC